MHIGIFGLAGAGKTTLTEQLSGRNPTYRAVSASRLIKEYGGVVEYEKLERKNIDLNQAKLICAYAELRGVHSNTLIELHALIESEEGVTEISSNVLRRLELDVAFFIFVTPDELNRRRRFDSSKKRRSVDVLELERLQSRAIDICRSALGKRLLVVDAERVLFEVERIIRSL